MVKGVKKFKEHFRDHTEKFVFIGGTACDLIMEDAGLSFRATRDLDIVLCMEAIDASFVQVFWEFIREGGYQIQEKATGEKQYYRFKKPKDDEYPYMLELFARVPDMLEIPSGAHLTPVPVDDSASCLSAILMDAPYYSFLLAGLRMLDGIPIVGPEHLIPLKAKAYLDLKERRADGLQIDNGSISKHKNDVFRLFRVVDPLIKIDVPQDVRDDMSEFLDAMEDEEVNLKSLGIRSRDKNSILVELRRMYTQHRELPCINCQK